MKILVLLKTMIRLCLTQLKLGIATIVVKLIYDKKDLIEIGEYYDRPAIELIFLPRGLHRKIHSKIHKPYFCKEAQIKGGRIAGKKYGHLNGKIGGKITMTNHPEIHKLGGHIVGSLPWWTNGIVNKKSVECPGEGFYRGQTRKR